MTDSSIPICLQDAKKVCLNADSKVFEPGDSCSQFYYLISGSIRVDLITRAGKPVTLYRFGNNETCILTTSCLFTGEQYNAQAVTETPVVALAISQHEFHAQLETSAEFRRLVFTSFAARLSSIMEKIEEVTSVPIEQRLAIRALELHCGNSPIEVTHEQLAADLGTAREVVSRKLASWESKGWIQRQRGSFSIIDRPSIQRLAQAG